MKTFIILLALTLSACVSIEEQAERAGKEANAPRWKIDAVKHGCISGRSAAGAPHSSFQKDYDQYKNNPDYRMVYDDAFAQCKGKYEAHARDMR